MALYRPEKPAQFEGTAQFGGGLVYFENVLEIAAHALNMAQDIMFFAQNFFKKMSNDRKNLHNAICITIYMSC